MKGRCTKSKFLTNKPTSRDRATKQHSVRAAYLLLLLAASAVVAGDGPSAGGTLADARKEFHTKLLRKVHDKEPVPQPPPELFRVVQYDSPAGKLAAYLSVPPKDKAKHPAMIWIFGGFDNGIGNTAWAQADPANDQSASAFRKADMAMMYPSLRGGNQNPGFRETFFGEVDDVLAAADFLAKQDFVDPKRIYLGGHSTGGTLVLLTAACTDRFRAIISFGPVANVAVYGKDNLVFDIANPMELVLRAPSRWLSAIRSPTYVFEGADGRSNIASLTRISTANKNPLIHFHPVAGFNHFSVLAAATPLIASKLVKDTEGPAANIEFTEDEIAKLARK